MSDKVSLVHRRLEHHAQVGQNQHGETGRRGPPLVTMTYSSPANTLLSPVVTITPEVPIDGASALYGLQFQLGENNMRGTNCQPQRFINVG
jgi:hypothetical protein